MRESKECPICKQETNILKMEKCDVCGRDVCRQCLGYMCWECNECGYSPEYPNDKVVGWDSNYGFPIFESDSEEDKNREDVIIFGKNEEDTYKKHFEFIHALMNEE